MAKRGSARKARVFSVPSHLQPAPPIQERAQKPVNEQKTGTNAITFEVLDREAAYLVGALIEATRVAELEQKHWTDAGNKAQAATFGQKVLSLRALTTRIAQAITRRPR